MPGLCALLCGKAGRPTAGTVGGTALLSPDSPGGAPQGELWLVGGALGLPLPYCHPPSRTHEVTRRVTAELGLETGPLLALESGICASFFPFRQPTLVLTGRRTQGWGQTWPLPWSRVQMNGDRPSGAGTGETGREQVRGLGPHDRSAGGWQVQGSPVGLHASAVSLSRA